MDSRVYEIVKVDDDIGKTLAEDFARELCENMAAGKDFLYGTEVGGDRLWESALAYSGVGYIAKEEKLSTEFYYKVVQPCLCIALGFAKSNKLEVARLPLPGHLTYECIKAPKGGFSADIVAQLTDTEYRNKLVSDALAECAKTTSAAAPTNVF